MQAFSAVDLGVIVPRYSTMEPNRGHYFVKVVRNRPELTDVPAKYPLIMYSSTDHDGGDGGIYVALATTASPTSAADWIDYDTAYDAGDFAMVANAPTKNPIYISDAPGSQTETPELHFIGGELKLYTHDNSGVRYEGRANQNTSVATGLGIVFTHQKIAITYNPRYRAGQQHTGYYRARMSDNLFGGGAIRGNCLHGGVGYYSSEVFTDNGVDFRLGRVWVNHNSPRFTQGLLGASKSQVASILDCWYHKKLPDGNILAIGSASISGVSGTQLPRSRVIQMIYSSDGHLISKPKVLLAPDSNVAHRSSGCVFNDVFEGADGNLYGVYVAHSGTNIYNVVANVALMRLDEADVEFEMIPNARAVTVSTEFKGASALPAGVSVYGSPSATTFDSNGINVQVAPNSVCGLQLAKNVRLSSPIVDFYTQGLRTLGTNEAQPELLLVANYSGGDPESHDTVIAMRPIAGSNTDRLLEVQRKLAGTELAGISSSQDVIGYGASHSSGRESPQAPRSIGLRVVDGKVYLYNEMGERLDGADVSGFPDTNYTPILLLRNNSATAETFVIESLELGDTATPLNEFDYSWQQLGGEPVTLVDPTAAATSFVAPAASSTTPLTFQVQATSAGGQTAIDSAQVYVRDPADITYAWLQVSGPAVTFADATAAETTVALTDPTTEGEVVLRLTASDPFGATASDTVAITFESVPVARITGDTQSTQGLPFELSAATSSAANGGALSYIWSVEQAPAGANVIITNPTSRETQIVSDAVGDVVIGLVVDDGTQTSAKALMTVAVNSPVLTTVRCRISDVPSLAGRRGVPLSIHTIPISRELHATTVDFSATGSALVPMPGVTLVAGTELQVLVSEYDGGNMDTAKVGHLLAEAEEVT